MVRFHTVTSYPASRNAPAMARPMGPSPMTVTVRLLMKIPIHSLTD